MLSIFRSNQLFLSVILIIYIGIFYTNTAWSTNAFVLLPTDQALAGALTRWIYSFVAQVPVLTPVLVGILIWVQALMCNNLVNTFRLSKQPTFITSIAFSLTLFLFEGGVSLSPPLIANLFLLLALAELFQTYDKKRSLGNIFNAGFWVGIASLCYWGCALYGFWVFFGLLILRPFEWREFVIVLSGFVVPIFLMGTLQFATDNFAGWWQQDILQHLGKPTYQLGDNLSLYSSLILFGLIILWLITNMSSVLFKATMQEQKCIQVLYLMLLIGGLSFGIQAAIQIQHFMILAIPVGILFGLSLQTIRNHATAELVHLTVFIYCLLVQYQVIATL